MTSASLDTVGPRELNFPEERKRAVYDAFASADPRFDGQVFVGVSSTGIYCRPVCKAKMPKYENCTFFRTAAEAEAAGYRPCMTCRPELAPGLSAVDASASLARRAASMIRERCTAPGGIEAIAAKLGYTGRHLRRAFAAEYGVTPSQYAQTCRLLLAKSLLTDSDLPVALVAEASGFGSVRRFNDAFKEHYRLTPTDLRKRGRSGTTPSGTATVCLGYRPPYRYSELLAFFKSRQLEGVELVDEKSYVRTVRLEGPGGDAVSGWLRVENDPKRNRLVVTMSESLAPCVPQVVTRVRSMFDVDCDPQAIAHGLAPLEDVLPGAVREGTRLPGCFDPFETACRAVLGQQTLGGRRQQARGTRRETLWHPSRNRRRGTDARISHASRPTCPRVDRGRARGAGGNPHALARHRANRTSARRRIGSTLAPARWRWSRSRACVPSRGSAPGPPTISR